MQSYHIQQGPILYCVDYYVELLGVLSILCENQEAICEAGCVQCNEAYVNEVQRYFSSADTAALTGKLELLSDQYNFNYDAPVQLMLMLSNHQEIDRQALFKDRKWIPDALFDTFLEELLRFESESCFHQFYEAHIPMYHTLLQHFITEYEQYNAHGFLLDFLKTEPQQQFCVNLMVGITNANYGATVGNFIYANICPYWESRLTPLPDHAFSPIYYSTLVLHEFAHGFINPMTAQFSCKIKEIDVSKYELLLKELYYGNSLETLINETIIRALECIYVKMHFPDQYETYIAAYISEGYTRIEAVVQQIQSPVNILELIQLFE